MQPASLFAPASGWTWAIDVELASSFHGRFDAVKPDDFRRLALALADAVESSHMRHPDFRIGGKVFASLGYPDNDWAMVKLVPEQQRAWIERDPLVFRPCNGVWGARGATNVHLASAKVSDVRAALKAAYENTKPGLRKRS